MLHRDNKDFIIRMFAVVSVLAFLAFPLTETIFYLLGSFRWPVNGAPVSGREAAFFLLLVAGAAGVWKFSGARLPSS